MGRVYGKTGCTTAPPSSPGTTATRAERFRLSSSSSTQEKPRIEKLRADHQTDVFDCGNEALNSYLTRFAWQNQRADSSQTYLALMGERVVGYYTLTVGEVSYGDAPERLAKGLSRYPVPVMILARLAVERNFQGQRLGQGLLLDAMRRTLQAAEVAGIRAILVHAKDDRARAFYEHFGFEAFPADSLTLYRLLRDIRLMIG
jgi:GNAT superfamily N-acetyltransferase